MAVERDPSRDVLRREEIDKALDELWSLVDERARDLRRVQESEPGPARRVESRQKPEIEDTVRAQLRRALESEVTVISEAEPDELIRLDEFEREIAKSALVKLKLNQLKNIAAEKGLDWRGTEEEIAERIGRAYNFDEQALARLILAHEEEPRPERGVTDRMYPLTSAVVDLASLAQSLAEIEGHYVRVGIARWFIFEQVTLNNDGLRVGGTFRAFRAEAEEADEEYGFRTTEVEAGAKIRISHNGRFLIVRARGATEASAAVRALEKVTRLRRLGGLPIETGLSHGELMQWDSRTILMLDLIDTRLNDPILAIDNLTAAHFEMDDSPAETAERRPRVRSVRIEGDYVEASVQACQLLVAGRALVGASFLLRYRPIRDESYLLPVRISLSKDHLTVLTGFGPQRHELAFHAQQEIVKRIQAAFEGIADLHRLEQLAARIHARARDIKPPERPDIFDRAASTPQSD